MDGFWYNDYGYWGGGKIGKLTDLQAQGFVSSVPSTVNVEIKEDDWYKGLPVEKPFEVTVVQPQELENSKGLSRDDVIKESAVVTSRDIYRDKLEKLLQDIANIKVNGNIDEEIREKYGDIWEYMQYLYNRVGTMDDNSFASLQEYVDALTGLVAKVGAGAITDVEAYINALEAERLKAEALARDLGYSGTIALEGEINWDRLKEGWSGLGTVFPFCIPFDIINMITSFSAIGERPEPITMNIFPFLPGNIGQVTLDLFSEDFAGALKILRIFLLLMFCGGLAILTGRVIRW